MSLHAYIESRRKMSDTIKEGEVLEMETIVDSGSSAEDNEDRDMETSLTVDNQESSKGKVSDSSQTGVDNSFPPPPLAIDNDHQEFSKTEETATSQEPDYDLFLPPPPPVDTDDHQGVNKDTEAESANNLSLSPQPLTDTGIEIKWEVEVKEPKREIKCDNVKITEFGNGKILQNEANIIGKGLETPSTSTLCTNLAPTGWFQVGDTLFKDPSKFAFFKNTTLSSTKILEDQQKVSTNEAAEKKIQEAAEDCTPPQPLVDTTKHLTVLEIAQLEGTGGEANIIEKGLGTPSTSTLCTNLAPTGWFEVGDTLFKDPSKFAFFKNTTPSSTTILEDQQKVGTNEAPEKKIQEAAEDCTPPQPLVDIVLENAMPEGSGGVAEDKRKGPAGDFPPPQPLVNITKYFKVLKGIETKCKVKEPRRKIQFDNVNVAEFGNGKILQNEANIIEKGLGTPSTSTLCTNLAPTGWFEVGDILLKDPSKFAFFKNTTPSSSTILEDQQKVGTNEAAKEKIQEAAEDCTPPQPLKDTTKYFTVLENDQLEGTGGEANIIEKGLGTPSTSTLCTNLAPTGWFEVGDTLFKDPSKFAFFKNTTPSSTTILEDQQKVGTNEAPEKKIQEAAEDCTPPQPLVDIVLENAMPEGSGGVAEEKRQVPAGDFPPLQPLVNTTKHFKVLKGIETKCKVKEPRRKIQFDNVNVAEFGNGKILQNEANIIEKGLGTPSTSTLCTNLAPTGWFEVGDILLKDPSKFAFFKNTTPSSSTILEDQQKVGTNEAAKEKIQEAAEDCTPPQPLVDTTKYFTVLEIAQLEGGSGGVAEEKRQVPAGDFPPLQPLVNTTEHFKVLKDIDTKYQQIEVKNKREADVEMEGRKGKEAKIENDSNIKQEAMVVEEDRTKPSTSGVSMSHVQSKSDWVDLDYTPYRKFPKFLPFRQNLVTYVPNFPSDFDYFRKKSLTYLQPPVKDKSQIKTPANFEKSSDSITFGMFKIYKDELLCCIQQLVDVLNAVDVINSVGFDPKNPACWPKVNVEQNVRDTIRTLISFNQNQYELNVLQSQVNKGNVFIESKKNYESICAAKQRRTKRSVPQLTDVVRESLTDEEKSSIVEYITQGPKQPQTEILMDNDCYSSDDKLKMSTLALSPDTVTTFKPKVKALIARKREVHRKQISPFFTIGEPDYEQKLSASYLESPYHKYESIDSFSDVISDSSEVGNKTGATTKKVPLKDSICGSVCEENDELVEINRETEETRSKNFLLSTFTERPLKISRGTIDMSYIYKEEQNRFFDTAKSPYEFPKCMTQVSEGKSYTSSHVYESIEEVSFYHGINENEIKHELSKAGPSTSSASRTEGTATEVQEAGRSPSTASRIEGTSTEVPEAGPSTSTASYVEGTSSEVPEEFHKNEQSDTQETTELEQAHTECQDVVQQDGERQTDEKESIPVKKDKRGNRLLKLLSCNLFGQTKRYNTSSLVKTESTEELSNSLFYVYGFQGRNVDTNVGKGSSESAREGTKESMRVEDKSIQCEMWLDAQKDYQLLSEFREWSCKQKRRKHKGALKEMELFL